MKQNQIDLLINRLIKKVYAYNEVEPNFLKMKEDLKFCNAFFGKDDIDFESINVLLDDAIENHNELELDLLLMLIAHFQVTPLFNLKIAPLLIQPWHHFHDRIAHMLELNNNENITDYLFLGSTYRCDNLDYESDYCEFNRKCLYALLKIGTKKALLCIKQVVDSDNKIIAAHAQAIVEQYNI